MIEAYKIAVNMTLTGDAHKKMGDFAKQADKASKSFKKLSVDLKIVNQLFGTLSKQLDRSNPSLKMLVRTFGIFGDQMRTTNRSMDYFNEGLRMSEGNTTRLRYQTDTLRNALRSLSAAGKEARASLTGIGRGRIGGGAAGGGGGGFGKGAKAFAAGAGIAGATGYLGPYAAAMAAGAVVKSSFTQEGQYNTYAAQLIGQGYSPDEIYRAKQLTNQVVPYSTPVKQMEAYVAAAQATKSKSRAEKLFPILAQAQAYAETSKYGKFTQHQVNDAVRSAEQLGGSDENKIAAYLGDVFRVIAASGGTIMPSDIRKMLTRGVSGLSERGLIQLEPMIQEMGASQVGTALKTGSGELIGRHFSNKAQAIELERLGIIGARHTEKIGGKNKVIFGALSPENAKLYNEAPWEFYRSVVKPAMEKQGITSLADKQNELNKIFARTPSILFYNMEKSFEKMERFDAMIDKLPGILNPEAIKKQAPESASMLGLTTSYQTFAKALGKFIDPVITGGMDRISDFLNLIAIPLTYLGNLGDSAIRHNAQQQTNLSNFFGKYGVTNPGSSFSSSNKPIAVYIDGNKAVHALGPHLMGNQSVITGTIGINYAYGSMANAVNNPGGFSQ